MHPDCLAAYEAATELLTELGHEVEEFDLPFDSDLVPHFETLWACHGDALPGGARPRGPPAPLTR